MDPRGGIVACVIFYIERGGGRRDPRYTYGFYISWGKLQTVAKETYNMGYKLFSLEATIEGMCDGTRAFFPLRGVVLTPTHWLLLLPSMSPVAVFPFIPSIPAASAIPFA